MERETISTKDKHKQRQELENTSREYEAKLRTLEEEEMKNGSNTVVLPDRYCLIMVEHQLRIIMELKVKEKQMH
jgi:hypothetical protein